jgi:uncharacterized membrane protein YtjA (UPF0391 family)
LPAFPRELLQAIEGESAMIEWIIILVIVAAVAGLLGFPKIAGAAWTGASVMAIIVLVGIGLLLLFGILAVAD